MTGFGAGRGEAGGEAISVELRAVNGKFCEVKTRLPRELSSLESELAKTIKGRISRGVVEAFVRREAGGVRGAVPHADLALAAAYAKAFRELKDSLGLAGEPTVQDLAALEGVISLGESAPAARKLEFLVQELNREINTIGSKSQHAGIAATVVDLKAELERIREQVQNVE